MPASLRRSLANENNLLVAPAAAAAAAFAPSTSTAATTVARLSVSPAASSVRFTVVAVAIFAFVCVSCPEAGACVRPPLPIASTVLPRWQRR